MEKFTKPELFNFLCEGESSEPDNVSTSSDNGKIPQEPFN